VNSVDPSGLDDDEEYKIPSGMGAALRRNARENLSAARYQPGSIERRKFSFFVDLLAGPVALAKQLLQGLTGQDAVAGTELSKGERVLAVGCAALPVRGAGLADDAAALAAKAARANASKLLRQNMKAAGVLGMANSAAHHIVAFGDELAAPARKILEHYGIDINSHVNGVFLPNKALMQGGAYHRTLHTEVYYSLVNARLQRAKSAQDVIWILQGIGRDLSNNTFLR
jgi:hypothetical protein